MFLTTTFYKNYSAGQGVPGTATGEISMFSHPFPIVAIYAGNVPYHRELFFGGII